MFNTTRRDRIQFAKFLVVGVVNTGFSYLIYVAALGLGFNYAIANLTALLIGIVFSFKTQGAIVFGNSQHRRFYRFVLVWTLIYVCNIFLISRFMAMGLDPYVSGACAIPFTTFLSYLSQKFFVFR